SAGGRDSREPGHCAVAWSAGGKDDGAIRAPGAGDIPEGVTDPSVAASSGRDDPEVAIGEESDFAAFRGDERGKGGIGVSQHSIGELIELTNVQGDVVTSEIGAIDDVLSVRGDCQISQSTLSIRRFDRKPHYLWIGG